MNSVSQEPGGNLKIAIDHALGLLQRRPAAAQRQAQEILRVVPGNAAARRILGAARRRRGDLEGALSVLEPLARQQPANAPVQHELGLTYAAGGAGPKAVRAFKKAVSIEPDYSDAWLSLGHQLALAGAREASNRALQTYLATSTPHPELLRAAAHLEAGELASAEPLVRSVLKKHPADVSAMRLLADIGIRVNRYQDAGNLLERCLELAPDYHLARGNYIALLLKRQELELALTQVNQLLAADNCNPNYLLLKGVVLVRMGDHLPALDIYEKILRDYPRQARPQLNYGHTLKTVGRVDEAIAAYRAAIEFNPGLGEAYWSLANLKTYRFSEREIDRMREAIAAASGDADNQGHLGFALGKALEDRGEYEESFKFYSRGNRIRRLTHRYDFRRNLYDTVRQINTCTRELFEQRSGQGCTAPDPVFIVGLPRAGSTLLEQILASHSQVEGTTELPDLIAISRKLGGNDRRHPAGRYPEILRRVSADELNRLGESYLETTRIQRGDRPYFIDKMPNNFFHVGLIHLMLPNAKIIDARRHPLAGCFAGFKQLFARGQTFTYDLMDIGRYYRNYLRIMDHWDEVLPGRVLHVQYEDMVADPETQIRRVLDYCKLPFEEQCLRFYETDRAIRTPSSEQVRQPIFTEGLEQWRNFEPYLDPLKKALGPVLERYPIEKTSE